MDGEMFAQPEDLIRPEMQLSPKIFAITDFEVNSLNTFLEAWVPNNTSRLMLTLAV